MRVSEWYVPLSVRLVKGVREFVRRNLARVILMINDERMMLKIKKKSGTIRARAQIASN